MTDLPLDQVRTLLAVVDEGTFDAAAAALHVTPSAVSQRVKALEQRTGRVLLMRTKPVRATESGEVVVRFARQLARLERDARAELGMSGAGDGGGDVVRRARHGLQRARAGTDALCPGGQSGLRPRALRPPVAGGTGG